MLTYALFYIAAPLLFIAVPIWLIGYVGHRRHGWPQPQLTNRHGWPQLTNRHGWPRPRPTKRQIRELRVLRDIEQHEELG